MAKKDTISSIKNRTTSNGLTLITEHLPGVRSVSLGFWVTVGSRDETPEERGLSHFLEHMIFKGTTSRSARDIATTIDSVGGQLDAFTSVEYTCFYSQVLDRDVRLAADLLLDILLNPRFDPMEINRERQVVLEEIKMVRDDPEDSAHEAAGLSMWGDHPLGKSILGEQETISRFSRDDFIHFRGRHFDGPNITFAASGAVDHNMLEDLVSNGFKDLSGNKKRSARAMPRFRRGITNIPRDGEQVHLILGFPAPAHNHPDHYPLLVLNNILGGSMSSRLFQEIREKNGWAYQIYSTPTLYSDAGALIIYAGVSPANLQPVLDKIGEELISFSRSTTAAAELEKAKGHLKGNIALGMERTSTRMATLARHEIYFRKIFSLEEVLSAIDRVTVDDVGRLASEIFTPGSGNLTLVGPLPVGGPFGMPPFVQLREPYVA